MPDEKDNESSSSLRGTTDKISNARIPSISPSISPTVSPFQKTAYALLQCFGITYIILPLIILIFGGPILREMTYLNHLFQKTCDINDYFPDPRSPNITSKTTFFNVDIESSQNYKIPAWYFQGDPEKPFVIYSHGNADSRCGGYRLKGYNSLVARGYSVLAYDYGGFSNSTKKEVLTDESLVQDLVDVLGFVEGGFLRKGQDLVLWGHSLGTGVTASAVAEFEKVRSRASVVVLDSPFSSFLEMVTKEVSLSRPFRAMYRSMWDSLITHVLEVHKVGTSLETRDNLLKIKMQDSFPPVIIAHTEDDVVIPFSQSEKLVKILKPKFGDKLTFFRIPGELGIGHYYILGKASDAIFDKIDELLG